MNSQFNPDRLDVRAFALASGQVGGTLPMGAFERIMRDCLPTETELHVEWQARGESRWGEGGQAQCWLHLDAVTSVPLICQRCLAPVETRLVVDRWFRFVADEATAGAQDDNCEEDLLVLTRDFNLPALVEDELVLEIPLAARHAECPVQPKLQVADPEFAELSPAREKPFAALAGLKVPNLGKNG
ncbi:MAG: DUF177 domain-containing protein [Burkholderiaceae bacterium]